MKNYLKNNFRVGFLLMLALFVGACSSTNSITQNKTSKRLGFNPDTVKAGKFDTGKMWTFEHAPLDYFEKTYGFRPTQQWLDEVRLASPKFANWCSSSFVSQDGLIMTNHHCIDFVSSRIEREGEDIAKNGFYAPTLEDERKIDGVFIQRLELIKDVTDEIVAAIKKGKTDAEKVQNRDAKIAELEKKYSNEHNLICQVTSLYNGGKYSLYGIKRYNDVRVVYFNERSMGFFGGDPDNYTYPRYDTDFAFLRVYDNGKPLQTEHYFKWSKEGAKPNEVIFTIGYPGTTSRLKTVSQLEFLRDIRYRNIMHYNAKQRELVEKLKIEHPENINRYEAMLMNVANNAKRYGGFYKYLNDEYFIARKRAFEKDFENAVKADTELVGEYGHLWEGLTNLQEELKKTEYEVQAFTLSNRNSPRYLLMARDLITLARQLKLPENRRADAYKSNNLSETIEAIMPANFDPALERGMVAVYEDYVRLNVGTDNDLYKKLFEGRKGTDAADHLISKSVLSTREGVKNLADKGWEAILTSTDPFIQYVLAIQERMEHLNTVRKSALDSEQVMEDMMGRALFEVYGTNIPPDATFTLRIGDGVVKDYEYNGTVAPEFTTFYGLYEKYYSHKKQYPWKLSEQWLNPGPEFDMDTPFNFISTNDIVGGSSGSPIINKDREIVGVAFDGNIESLSGNFIYAPEKNRNVGVASQGMLEIIRDLHKYYRLANELEQGKLSE